MRWITRPLVAFSAVTLVMLPAGCTSPSGSDPAPVAESARRPPSTAATSPTPTAERPTQTPAAGGTAVIATVPGLVVDVFAAPGDARPVRSLTAAEVVSLPGETPVTLLVAEQAGDWVRVHLPVRPNGTTGWVRLADITLSATDLRVEVRLSEHRLRLHRGADVVMDVPVGVGRAEVPTPGGVYYIKELLRPPTEGSIYGAYAYGLSGFSPVLESFAGGAGVIGIHGTNDPASVGSDASHGCLRLTDDDVTRLVEEFGLPLGTPVTILP